MQFQVPQFIERESKVVGPFTFKQFIYLAIPGAMGFFLYFTMPFTVFVAGSALFMFMGAGLAFFKVGGKSLPELLILATFFAVSPKTYIWEKGSHKIKDALAQYSQTRPEQDLALQIKLKKGSAVRDLSEQIR